MDSSTYPEALSKFLRDKLRNVHTIKPAIVTRVYGNRVSVKPLTTTKYHDGTHLPLPILDDVPLMIYSGQKGKARVTVPVGAGDLVMVLCSDRDTGDLLDSTVSGPTHFLSDDITPLELYPILAIPSFFTLPSEKSISSTDVVIENGSTKITVSPDGNVQIDTDADLVANAGGDVNVNSGGDVNIVSEGAVNVSAATSMTINATAPISVVSPSTVFTGSITAPAIYAPIIAPALGGPNQYLHVHDYVDVGAVPTAQVTGPARAPTP